MAEREGGGALEKFRSCSVVVSEGEEKVLSWFAHITMI
jgi:hypothetical protein